MKLARLLTVAAIPVLVASGCGGDESAQSSPPANEDSTSGDEEPADDSAEEDAASQDGSSYGGECTINVTGDLVDTVVYPTSVYTFTSDHWNSEEQLRDIAETFGEDAAGGSYDDLVSRGEPIIGWFLYNCVDPDNPGAGVTVIPTNDTTADGFPKGPGIYPVSGGLFDATGPAGTVITNFSVTPEEQFHPVPGSGDLVITQWDDDVLEASISFDAVESFAPENPREIHVDVEFSVNR